MAESIIPQLDKMDGAKIVQAIVSAASENGKTFSIESGTRALMFSTSTYANVLGIYSIAATTGGSSASNPLVTASGLTFTTGSAAGANRFTVTADNNCFVAFLVLVGGIAEVIA